MLWIKLMLHWTNLLAQYIKSETGTQHIVISLRKNMYQ
jgi:hypothetical protein